MQIFQRIKKSEGEMQTSTSYHYQESEYIRQLEETFYHFISIEKTFNNIDV